MKKILILIFTFFPFVVFATWELNTLNGIQINYDINIDEEIKKTYKPEISINTNYEINLETLEENLKIINPTKNFSFVWNLKWASTQSGSVFKRTFSEKWEKELELTIKETLKGSNDENDEKIIFNKTYEILVYEKSFFLIYSDEIDKNDVNSYIDFSKKDGVFINTLWPLNKTDIELTNITNNIENYEKLWWLKSDFIIVWWARDFIFNILSNINRELIINQNTQKKYNIISLSNYNINILSSYLRNFLANKFWINKLVLLNENSKYLILKQNLISDLEKELTENKHDFIDINLKNNEVNNLFFISKFINNLSNLWYSTTNIYIFLIIPIILTIIVVFKHFIWFSPIWITIPLFLTLLFLKIWFFLSLFLIFLYICLNLFLSLIIDRYNLLYAPKIVFLIIINFIFFILFINIGYSLNLISLNLSDILYFVIFIIISEKIINIITSKDLLEYKESFFYTILIWVFSFTILKINSIKVLMLSYPEIILLLIPINFMIWRFSWLRITEYFRFKEIIKNIEE